MRELHDPRDRAEIVRRVHALRPDSTRQWGRMSIGQMLWHVNQAMESALGRLALSPRRVPLPRAAMKFMVITLPWPKGSPTLAEWVPPTDRYDFQVERDRCLRLIAELASKPLDSEWPASPTLGPMSGHDVSRLQAKHLHHHLTQFGV